MEHYKAALIAAVKMAPAWIGVAVGHFISGITLSGVAFCASIVYSAVHTFATLRAMRKG